MIAPLKKLKKLHSHPGMEKMSLWRIGSSGIQYYVRKDGYAAPPLKIYLVVNTVCNANCRMCDVNKKDIDSDFARALQLGGGRVEVPFETIQRYAREFSKFRPIVGAMGTEPLLYSKIVETAAEFTRAGCDFHLTTNGLLLPRFAERLVDTGLEHLFVSVDGPAETHDYIRGVKGLFSKIEEGIAMISELKKKRNLSKPHVSLNFTLSNDNMEKIVEYGQAIKDWDIEHSHFSFTNFVTEEMAERHNSIAGDTFPCSPVSNLMFDPAKMKPEVIYKQIQELTRILPGKLLFIPELDLEGIRVFYQEHDKFVAGDHCMIAWGGVMIQADGSLMPSSRCFTVDCGNVSEKPFLEVWNGEKMRAFRKAIQKDGSYPACSRCCAIL